MDDINEIMERMENANVTILFLELSKNLRCAEDLLDSCNSSCSSCSSSDDKGNVHAAKRFAEQSMEILEEHDKIKEFDCWSNHRKQLKEWAKDILLKVEERKKQNKFKDKFDNLSRKWKEETLITSSVSEIISNKSYLEIIDMGREVLPLIFQDLKSDPAFWFFALEKLTGFNPIESSHRGIIKLMKEDWLKWGKENGYV